MIIILFARLIICSTLTGIVDTPIIGGEKELFSDLVIETSIYQQDESIDVKELIVDAETITDINNDSRIINSEKLLSDQEIRTMYEAFVISKKSVVSQEEYYSPILMEEFVDQLVDDGYIEDTPIQRGYVPLALVRANFLTVVSLGRALGYTTAATLLEHSLQDNPYDLSYSSNTTYARQIQYSSECNSIVNSVRNYVRGKNISYYSCSSHISLSSTTDLLLAYHDVDYVVTARKTGNRWNLSIVFSDTYDFEAQSWENFMTDNQAITIINNYAAFAQSQGVIVPYDVSVTVSTSFTQ